MKIVFGKSTLSNNSRQKRVTRLFTRDRVMKRVQSRKVVYMRLSRWLGISYSGVSLKEVMIGPKGKEYWMNINK